MPACKILIIDDDDDIRDALVALLAGEGYEAQGARSGLAALTAMTWGQFAPDAIVLDHLMPAMDGDQFRTVVQKNPRWQAIPIIFCTGNSIPDGLSKSVFAVLQKPFDLDALLEIVKRACGCADAQ